MNQTMEKDFALNNWLKICMEMGYTDEQIDSLMRCYYGEDWQEHLVPEE